MRNMEINVTVNYYHWQKEHIADLNIANCLNFEIDNLVLPTYLNETFVGRGPTNPRLLFFVYVIIPTIRDLIRREDTELK